MKKKSTDCAHIQQLLSSDVNDIYDNAISEHLMSCSECQKLMEKAEEPSRKRELIAVSIAIVALVIIIIAVVLSY